MAPAHPRGPAPGRQGPPPAGPSPFDCLSAEYQSEARPGSKLPPPTLLPEVAFAGKSNVGKSTLLNRLTQRKSLARTSKTPGCTRGIVLFRAKLRDGTEFVIADLPGYGFAERSKNERLAWGGLIEDYIQRRAALRLVVVLVDGRRGLADDERQLIDWLQHIHRDFIVAVTKVDKLSKPERGNALRAIRQATGATVVGVSGLEGDGREDLLRLIRSAVHPDELAQSGPEPGMPGEIDPSASPAG